MLKLILNNTPANVDQGVAIMFTIIFVLVAGAAIFFLQRGIRKERNRYMAEKLDVGEMDRAGFDDMMTRRFATATKNTYFSVMFIEINEAKDLKESFGEKQYQFILDTLIKRFYKVLPKSTKICLYDYDLIAAVINEDLDRKPLSDLSSFCIIEGHRAITLVTRVQIEVDISIGVASYNAFSATYEQFRQNLELSVAASKRNGLNKFTIYSADLLGADSEEIKYYQEIKAAIEANEFTLYYQPIYDLNSNQPVGYESLLRWNHKTLGVVSPSKFLTILEQSGDITWVGNWAFTQLLKTAEEYRTRHPDKHVLFTMNLSPKQLMSATLVEDFRKALRKFNKVPAADICMEIVEFAMFDKMQAVADNIEKLQQCGFKIAIDDFGLEMSSLKMLENIHVDWIKLDKKFVEQSKDDFLFGGLIGTLVGFAERSGSKIVAEGVEDDVIVEYLKDCKIQYGQGYYFGKPLPAADYFSSSASAAQKAS